MVKKIIHKENKKIKIFYIGDMHLGSSTFAKAKFENALYKIKRLKYARAILMGDYGDFIESDDTRRYDANCVDKVWSNAPKQYNAILKYFKLIKKKIIGILRGNHEAVYAKFHKDQFSTKIRDHAELLAHDLGVPYLEDLGIIELHIKKHIYNLVVAHGSGSSTKLAGQIAALNNIINGFEIVPDVVCMGHVHALQTIVNPKMNFNFQTKIKHLGLTGNFYQTYIEGNINYASSCLYNPLPIGCITYDFDENGKIEDGKVIL